MFSSIWWRITAPYIAIILLATMGLTLFLSLEARNARMEDLADHLLDDAKLMARDAQLLQSLAGDAPNSAALDRLAVEWSALIEKRITVVGVDGTVLGESHADAAQMASHLNRPEIQLALRDGVGMATRFSQTQRTEVMYAAMPVLSAGQLLGFVRVAMPLDEVQANVNRLSRGLLIAGVLTALVTALLATYTVSRTVAPIRRLTETVQRVAAGDLSGRLLPTTRDEVGQLTRSFNYMADQLQEKVATLALEQARLSTVLEHMADGVIITDEAGVVVMINAAAARILRYDEDKALGRRFAQIAYSHQLIELWSRCCESGVQQTETVETPLYGTFLHAVITPLPASDPPRYLVMLQDLTHIRRLETVRRDFISNISHELRTPLASLALVVETLRDGAIEDPPAARRFLRHMETELLSLTQLVEELLELSRIESGRVPLTLSATPVRELVHQPIERLDPQAERKGVTLTLAIAENLPPVLADAPRMRQVIANLLHNAIKFTPSGGTINVFARPYTAEELGQVGDGADDGAAPPREIVIGVADTGLGIPDDDLPRIFERFYKTDRARAQQGTGLGLAISKHIVQMHHGRIWVRSIEGVGSTFYLTLPMASESATG